MNGGFGKKKDLMRYSKPKECSICHQFFLTPHALILHSNTFHSKHHFSTAFSSSASTATAPTTFRRYTNFNRNPNPTFTPGKSYHIGYVNEQRRFHRRPPAITKTEASIFLFGQENKPKLMDLFPVTSQESVRTLPLICQLDQRRPENYVTNKGRAFSSSIDLTLRL